MTALQQIIKEAKILRKKNPKMEWKKAVAQASSIYARKHKGKSPVGKKHKKVARKKAAKKVGTVKRKVARKKKPSEQSILNKIHRVKHDVEKLDEAQHKHISGISGMFFNNVLAKIKNAYYDIDKAEKLLKRYNKVIREPKYSSNIDEETRNFYIKEREKLKKYIKEHKTHITELKRSI